MGGFPTINPTSIAARHPGLRIIDPVRPGGQKQVWKVSYQGQTYALKIISSAPENVERAKREIGIMRQCKSPQLVRMGPMDLHYIPIGGQAYVYYLEEFIEGTPLDSIPKPMPLGICKALGLQLTYAVTSIWSEGYVHRDIKPSNVMLRSDGRTFVLLDAGLALDLAGASITRAGGVVGTQLYWCPDQIRIVKRKLDFRADLYAIGTCMYECITGVHPLWNPRVTKADLIDNILNQIPLPLIDFRPDTPVSLQEIVLRTLEKEPNLRYSKLEYFVAELEALQIP
jgi:serine/threonine protein kinase